MKSVSYKYFVPNGTFLFISHHWCFIIFCIVSLSPGCTRGCW